ncbi:MAG: type I restriction enzyme HsdR N-terminal domain-containing protein, partial [Mangrovibacterium sp.]
SKLGEPGMFIEFKAPEVKITQKTFDQVARYNLCFEVPFLMVSNGMEHYGCQVDVDTQYYRLFRVVPGFDELQAAASE